MPRHKEEDPKILSLLEHQIAKGKTTTTTRAIPSPLPLSCVVLLHRRVSRCLVGSQSLLLDPIEWPKPIQATNPNVCAVCRFLLEDPIEKDYWNTQKEEQEQQRQKQQQHSGSNNNKNAINSNTIRYKNKRKKPWYLWCSTPFPSTKQLDLLFFGSTSPDWTLHSANNSV